MPQQTVRYITGLKTYSHCLKEQSSDFRLIFEESIKTNESHVYAAKQLNPHLDNGL